MKSYVVVNSAMMRYYNNLAQQEVQKSNYYTGEDALKVQSILATIANICLDVESFYIPVHVLSQHRALREGFFMEVDLDVLMDSFVSSFNRFT